MQKFIKLLESQLGYSEKAGGHTKFGDWYGGNVEFDADYTAAPWCDMYLSWAANKLGYEDWIGQFAYTVYHAQWFRQQDAWGTVPRPGALVFFDWSGAKKIDGIDHVGIVTAVEGRTIYTIEGNIDGGIAKRKKRDTDKVVGYGYPEKIKARLDKEASRQQEVVTSDAHANNSVELSSGPSLLSMMPPGLIRETETSAGPARAKTGPKHAKPATASAVGSPAENRSPGEAKDAPAPQTVSRATGAPSPQASAGRTGKHAKPAAADTNAVAAAPASRDLSLDAPQLGSPTILAPVLLAAVAIIAHARTKQSKARPAPATAGVAAPARRTPGRRRSPGRRRITKNAPVLAGAREGVVRTVPETTLATATVAGFPSVTTPLSHVEESPLNRVAARTGQGLAAELRSPATLGSPPALSSPSGLRPPAEFAPAVRSSLTRVEEALSPAGASHAGGSGTAGRRHDGPRLPYQGRRRLRERPVVESSTFVQDAPLRGRRHRRSESVVSTTMPTTRPAPRNRATSTAPDRGRATSTAPERRPAHALPAAARTAEDGDILAHSGYQGRRRARVPV
ncbi:CHAP domain-containing protein [Streptosporangium sp. NPDC051022]|uniref:CHAP domain-containing protein n=1 Tax=Streptosporangium sp. NPDC051022 TaxID=3155752 RepID=UPI003441DF17